VNYKITKDTFTTIINVVLNKDSFA